MKEYLKNNRQGFSLVEVLLSAVVLGTIGWGIASLFIQSTKQANHLKTQIEYASFLQLASNILGRPNNCSCNFQGLVFDSANSSLQIPVSSIKESCAAGASLLIKKPGTSGIAGLQAQDIYLKNMKSTGNSNEYSGQLFIVAQSNGVAIKPIPIPLHFYTDPSSPLNAKIILGCGQAPLTVPTGLNAVAGNTQCSFSWNPSSGEMPISYTIRSSIAPGGASTGSIVATTTAQGYMVGGLTNGTTYYFAIQATNSSGTTSFSPEVSCTPLAPPSVPSLSASPQSTSSCLASWSASTGTAPNTYELRSSSAAGSASSGSVVCNGASQSCTVSGLSAGVTYYFAVRSMNAMGSSAYSSPEATCTPFSAPCTTPWGTSVASGASAVAFQAPTVLSPAVCTSESRTCNNGTLSGSFTNQACTVNSPTCTTPWGASVPNGSSVVAYLGIGGVSCTSETRVCTNGTLSGTYQFQNCTPYSWHCTPGTRPAASGNGVRDVTYIAPCSGRGCRNPNACNCNGPGFNYTPPVGTSCSYNSYMSGGNNYLSCVYSCTYY